MLRYVVKLVVFAFTFQLKEFNNCINPLDPIFIKEGANKQVISSQADSLIKISRIWADFFPQTHRISLFRLFFHHFWRYFRFY